MSEVLIDLEAQIRKDSAAYLDDYLSQVRHLNSSIEIFKINPGSDSKTFVSLLKFICNVAKFYVNHQETRCIAPNIISLLKLYETQLHTNIRKNLVVSLVSLRNQELVRLLDILPCLFSVFKIKDKSLRTLVHNHIVNDIARINKELSTSSAKSRMNKRRKKKTQDNQAPSSSTAASPLPSSQTIADGESVAEMNRKLQGFVFEMIKDSNKVISKKALDVLISLYYKNVWKDEKSVNVMKTCCFSDETKMLVTSLYFFTGAKPKYIERMEKQMDGNDGDSDDSGDSGIDERDRQSQIKELRRRYVFSHSKKTQKKKKKYEKGLKKLHKMKNRTDRNNESQYEQSLECVYMVHDCQKFAEKLFGKLKNSNQRFETKVLMMDVISRCIFAHKLILINFYPFVQRYIEPSQLYITRILTIISRSVHNFIPEDVLHPVLMTIANNFIHDRSNHESVAIALNAIKEICVRQPLVMNKSLLRDLSHYGKSKSKLVFHAARSLIKLYRILNPKLLHKKFRGKVSSDQLTNNIPEFAHQHVYSSVKDIHLLDPFIVEPDQEENEQNEQQEDLMESDDESTDQEEDGEHGEDQRQIQQFLSKYGTNKTPSEYASGDESDYEEVDSEGESIDPKKVILSRVDQFYDKQNYRIDMDKLNKKLFQDESDSESDTNNEANTTEASPPAPTQPQENQPFKDEPHVTNAVESKDKRGAAEKLVQSRVLTQEEFVALAKLRHREATRKRTGKKQKKGMLASESTEPTKDQLETIFNSDNAGFLTEGSLLHSGTRTIQTDDMSDDSDDTSQQKEKAWKYNDKRVGSSKTNIEKVKNKPFMMVKMSRNVRQKNSLGTKVSKIKKKMSAQRLKKWKLKHH